MSLLSDFLHDWRTQPRGRWVAVLGAMLVASFSSVAWMQWRQFDQITSSARLVDDNIAWSFFQLEVEYHKLSQALHEAVEQPDDSRLLTLGERYEIFVSRVDLVDPAKLRTEQPTPPQHGLTWLALTHFVAETDRLMEVNRAAPTPQELASLAQALAALQEPIRELSRQISQQAVEQRAVRNDLIRDRVHLGIGLTAFLSLITTASAIIAVHLWRASIRRGRELEDLAANLGTARETADAANHAKSAFLATMSHELRTPFNGLLGMLALLDDHRLDAEQKHFVLTARDSAEHLLSILNDILDLSRLEAGKLELDPRPLDLHRLVSEVQTVMQPSATAKGLSLSVELGEPLPDWVLADARRLKQILFNLLSNAIKFTVHGHVRLQVHRAAPGSDELLFVVADTGIGMDAGVQSRLFQRFSQGDASISRRYGGTGLGLEISRTLARSMGGDISATSKVGVGSRFTLQLRLAPCQAPASPMVPPAPLTHQRPIDILVAEDHAINRMYVGTLLSRLGHQVRFAVDGEDAVRQAQQHLPDLILMDLQMPGMDGMQACRELRRRPGPLGRVKIVAVTADAISQTRDQALSAGMDDYLTKPFQVDDMLQVLAKHGPASTALRPQAAPDAAPQPAPRSPDLAAAPAPVQDEQLGQDAIQALRALLSDDGYAPLLRAFFADESHTLADLEQALQARDQTAMAALAHQLKGAAHLLGLEGLAEHAARLESASTDGTPGRTFEPELRQLRQLRAQTLALCQRLGLLTP